MRRVKWRVLARRCARYWRAERNYHKRTQATGKPYLDPDWGRARRLALAAAKTWPAEMVPPGNVVQGRRDALRGVRAWQQMWRRIERQGGYVPFSVGRKGTPTR